MSEDDVAPPLAAVARHGDCTLAQLRTAGLFGVLSVAVLGIAYPLALTLAGNAFFPVAAGGSLVFFHGKPIGSELIGQAWSEPRYFHGRPSAAGKRGYDPTSTGGTNLGPTSKELIDTTRTELAALRRANPQTRVPVPMDLVTSSGSGIDPDISPEAALYQVPRVAQARHLAPAALRAVVARHVRARTLGFLGEPHVNVLELNLALDGAR